MTDTDTRNLLEAFAMAWSTKEPGAVLDLMTDDCIYDASVGPEPGRTFRGREEVRQGLIEMFAHDDGSVAEVSNLAIFPPFAFWEWQYVWPEGSDRKPQRGCDLFEIRDGKIHRKNAFRKTEKS